MKRYDKNASIGTYMSIMLPYSLIFLLAWIILLGVFYFTGLPLGPGVYTFLEDRVQ
nr:AbgT family transporter [Jeotgalicoccus sp. WY2]